MSATTTERTGCPVLHFDHRAAQTGQRFESGTSCARWGRSSGRPSTAASGWWAATTRWPRCCATTGPSPSAKHPDGTGGQSIPPFIWQRNVPGEYDGEEHVRLRSVLLPPLSPKLIEGRSPIVAGLVSEIFDRLEGRAEVDATREIAIPVPAHSMFTFLGLPREDAEPIGLTVHEIMGTREGSPRQPS